MRFRILYFWLLFAGIVTSTIPALCFQTEYYLYTSLDGSGILPVLKILPSGEIVTTEMVYPLVGGGPCFGYLSSKRMLIVAYDYAYLSTQQMVTYKINSDFTLTELSQSTSTTRAFSIDICPNEELLFKNSSYGSEIWSIDSLGHLTNTGNTFVGYFNNPVRPQGDITIPASFGTIYIPIYSINYGSRSVTSPQHVSITNLNKIIFSPDGRLALGIGHEIDGSFGINNKNIALFGISSTGSVSTSSILYGLGYIYYPFDEVITPDGQYLFIEGTPGIATIKVNSITTTIQDTGSRYSYPTTNNGFNATIPEGGMRVTPDGRMLVYMYQSSLDGRNWVGTAFINGDGSLTWTGYTFPYDSTFGGGSDFLYDMLLVPNYTTSIPPELWGKLE